MNAPNNNDNSNVIWIFLAATTVVGSLLIAVVLITFKNLNSTERFATEPVYIDHLTVSPNVEPSGEGLVPHGIDLGKNPNRRPEHCD